MPSARSASPHASSMNKDHGSASHAGASLRSGRVSTMPGTSSRIGPCACWTNRCAPRREVPSASASPARSATLSGPGSCAQMFSLPLSHSRSRSPPTRNSCGAMCVTVLRARDERGAAMTGGWRSSVPAAARRILQHRGRRQHQLVLAAASGPTSRRASLHQLGPAHEGAPRPTAAATAAGSGDEAAGVTQWHHRDRLGEVPPQHHAGNFAAAPIQPRHGLIDRPPHRGLLHVLRLEGVRQHRPRPRREQHVIPVAPHRNRFDIVPLEEGKGAQQLGRLRAARGPRAAQRRDCPRVPVTCHPLLQPAPLGLGGTRGRHFW